MHMWRAGAVQTLMSVDADRVINLCASLHELWSLPAQIAIALYLLYTQVRHPAQPLEANPSSATGGLHKVLPQIRQ